MPMNAASIMTQRVVTVGPDETVAEVARTLAQGGISAAPVCDKDGKLLGMISEGDLVRPFAQDSKLDRSWWLGMLAKGAGIVPALLEYIRSDRHRASDLMTHPVITAGEATALSDLAKLLQRHRIKRVPIVRNGKLIGVVSRADLISALTRALDTPGTRAETPVATGSTSLHWSPLRSPANRAGSGSPKKGRTRAAPD
jgi:CBS domain-containing protein